MSKRHFLVAPAAAGASGPTAPPPRWLEAFPDGQWGTWSTLDATLRAGDTVWLAVDHADWETRLRELRQFHPGAVVVVMSPVPTDTEGMRALDAGARGYVHLLAVPAMLREVEQVVLHGGLWAGPELVQRLLAATRELLRRSPEAARLVVDLAVLSDREAQVARAVASGKSNREVAEQLFISERTVKAHLGSIFEKLGARDRVQLALLVSGAEAPAPQTGGGTGGAA